MNKLWLYKQLRRHRKLAVKRMVDLNKNKAAKWFMGFVEGIVIVYLLMFAIMFALIANDLRTCTSVEFIMMTAPGLMAVDFFLRFTAQQTPSQIIKPYVLLPLPKYTCVDFFMAGQMLSWDNLTWYILLVPYCLMSVVFSYGIWPCIGLMVFFWIMELCVSQYYLIVRTLLNDTLRWWILPATVAIIALLPGFNWDMLMSGDIIPSKVFDITDSFGFYGIIGRGIENGHIWPYLLITAILAVLTFINRRVQYSHVMAELTMKEKAMVIKNSSAMKFLDRFGELGLYLGLEIKTTMRNKNPRKSFIMGTVICILFAIICSFTDVYDESYMQNFWCLYCYCIFPATTLVKIMCNEGNYIDGLMVRKENILQILTAKYWFNCIYLLMPFILLLIPVFSGKWSIMMVLSYGIFTAGFQLFLLFQLAVINRISQPLNTKFISKNGMENNKWQIIIEMVCMFVPVVLVSILQNLLSANWAYTVMLVIGLAFILTHRLWLRNIYNRFMRKRYQNIDGFRASR